MRYFSFPDNRLFRISLGLFFFALLYLSRDTMVSHYLLGFYKAQGLSVGLMALLGAVFLWVNRRNWKAIALDGRLVVAALSAACLLIPMLAKRDWQMTYLSIILAIFLSVFLSYFLTCRQSAKYYVVIMAGLSLYSLLTTYLFRIPADRGLLVPPVFINAFDAPFYNYGLSFVSVAFAKERNFGIFREPGVYQYFLMLALYLNNYQVDWRQPWRMWAVNALLMLTMLSTFSTGGVAAACLLAVVVFFDKKVYREKLGKIFTLSVLVILAVLAVYLVAAKPKLYTTLYLMINKVFSMDNSASERLESIRVNLHILSFEPWFGRKVAYVLHLIENNTSSTTIFYAICGVIFGNLHVVAWLALLWERKRKVLWNFLCVAAMFVVFNTQNLVANPFLWIFPMMTLTEKSLTFRAKLRERSKAERCGS